LLSYQHDYHAGNHADVLKHTALVLLIQALERKPAALRVIDSHAGSGVYDLAGHMAQHGREFETGVALVRNAGAPPPSVRRYFEVLDELNASGALLRYPGSPEIAARLLREQDQLELFELHPQAATALRKRYARNPQIHVHRRDGFEGLVAVVPPKERRGIVLIDPAYEEKEDFGRVAHLVGACRKRWANGVYMIWYPLIRHAGADRLIEALRELAIPRTLRVELEVAPNSDGLRGSGLVIANLPFQVERELRELVPWLGRVLAQSADATNATYWL
jgi:23S rRNA (adenine2030-N6)-methyltransferase